jgi:hypothetical protein
MGLATAREEGAGDRGDPRTGNYRRKLTGEQKSAGSDWPVG